MLRTLAALAGILTVLAASPCRGQDEPGRAATTEAMIETAREVWRPPGLRRGCPAPQRANEIVVCAENPDKYRVASPTDEAIERGEAVDDGLPRAPDVFGIPAGGVTVAKGCFIPPCPRPMPPLIDFSALPEPLTPEQAARVFRAEDAPPGLSPEAASPTEVP